MNEKQNGGYSMDNLKQTYYQFPLSHNGIVKVVCDEENFIEALSAIEFIRDRLLESYSERIKKNLIKEYKEKLSFIEV
jgi:hypothetical protein